MDKLARGGKRRYLDSVTPEEYVPDTGEVDLKELSLEGLADLFGSDKGSLKHKYTEIYRELIRELLNERDRKTAILNVAEFGVACAASLRMWANYLPNSNIVGMDIRPDCAALCEDLEKVRIEIGDPAQWVTSEKYDLIVDDASHISEQIVAALRNCWPKVKPGGYYVVEDLGCTYSDNYTSSYRRNFDANAINDRREILILIDEIMRVIDARGDVAELRYHPELLVLKKKQ